MRTPTVSIFIPAYNREAYLPATLDSLLAQTLTDFEIVIADDGSTDGTLAVARDYASRDQRIRVLSLPHEGEVAARNAALRALSPSSRYLMNHDSDDISLPEKLCALVAYLDTHPDIAVVGCQAKYFNDDAADLGQPPIETSPGRIRQTFGRVNSMINSASLIRREVFDSIGGYSEAYRSADDYDFFARALMAGFQFANLPNVLHRIRLHPNSVSAERTALQQSIAAKISAHYDQWLTARTLTGRLRHRVRAVLQLSK